MIFVLPRNLPNYIIMLLEDIISSPKHVNTFYVIKHDWY